MDKKSNNILDSKDTEFSLFEQGVSSETCALIMNSAYESVQKGVSECFKFNGEHPIKFKQTRLKPLYMNATIKECFIKDYFSNKILLKEITHLKSHGVDYFVLGGKFILCFKKMDKKGHISGFNSERFRNLMDGNKVQYSKKMLDNLSDMGILKPLPVYFVGHIINKFGNLDDVRMVRYANNEIVFQQSLSQLIETDLFTIEPKEIKYEIVVKPKSKFNNPKKKLG